MSKLVAAIAALIVLLVAILLLAPNLIPTETYRGPLQEAASDALGREVTIGENISFKIIPTTAFSVSDLVIANADGFEGPHLAKIASADIGVALFPLLSKRVQVSNFVLTEPDLNLEIAADGSVNWELGPVEAAENTGSQAPEDTQGAGDAPDIQDLQFGDVRLVSGKIALDDRQAKQTYLADDVNVRVRLASLDEPLEANGDLVFQGAPAKINLIVTTLADYLDNKPSNMKLDATLGEASVGADLSLQATTAEGGAQGLSYAGDISIDAPDLPALARLFAVELADAPGFDRLSVNGRAEGTQDGVLLKNAAIGFDAIDATGDLGLNWSGAKPKATGALSTGALDLRPYLPPPSETSEGFPAWSEDPLDFTSLRNIDAEFDLQADAIYLNGMKADESRLQITVANGRMTAEMPTLNLYGGAGSGRLVVNARRATPSFSGVFNLGAVNAEAMAIDMLKIDRLLGIGSVDIDFTAAGASQAAIMSSLDGKGGFNLADGALKGVNIVKLVQGVQDLTKGGLQAGLSNPAALVALASEARQPTEQTEYSKFLCAFTMNNGLIDSPTISMEGPFLAMNGIGKINLPGQTLDIRLSPSVTADAAREGNAFTAPVRISGSFANPGVSVDSEALLRGQVGQKGRDLLNKALGGKDGEDSPVSGVIDSLVGGGSGDGETSVEDAAVNAIGGLFGSRRKKDEEEPENKE